MADMRRKAEDLIRNILGEQNRRDFLKKTGAFIASRSSAKSIKPSETWDDLKEKSISEYLSFQERSSDLYLKQIGQFLSDHPNLSGGLRFKKIQDVANSIEDPHLRNLVIGTIHNAVFTPPDPHDFSIGEWFEHEVTQREEMTDHQKELHDRYHAIYAFNDKYRVFDGADVESPIAIDLRDQFPFADGTWSDIQDEVLDSITRRSTKFDPDANIFYYEIIDADNTTNYRGSNRHPHAIEPNKAVTTWFDQDYSLRNLHAKANERIREELISRSPKTGEGYRRYAHIDIDEANGFLNDVMRMGVDDALLNVHNAFMNDRMLPDFTPDERGLSHEDRIAKSIDYLKDIFASPSQLEAVYSAGGAEAVSKIITDVHKEDIINAVNKDLPDSILPDTKKKIREGFKAQEEVIRITQPDLYSHLRAHGKRIIDEELANRSGYTDPVEADIQAGDFSRRVQQDPFTGEHLVRALASPSAGGFEQGPELPRSPENPPDVIRDIIASDVERAKGIGTPPQDPVPVTRSYAQYAITDKVRDFSGMHDTWRKSQSYFRADHELNRANLSFDHKQKISPHAMNNVGALGDKINIPRAVADPSYLHALVVNGVVGISDARELLNLNIEETRIKDLGAPELERFLMEMGHPVIRYPDQMMPSEAPPVRIGIAGASTGYMAGEGTTPLQASMHVKNMLNAAYLEALAKGVPFIVRTGDTRGGVEQHARDWTIEVLTRRLGRKPTKKELDARLEVIGGTYPTSRHNQILSGLDNKTDTMVLLTASDDPSNKLESSIRLNGYEGRIYNMDTGRLTAIPRTGVRRPSELGTPIHSPQVSHQYDFSEFIGGTPPGEPIDSPEIEQPLSKIEQLYGQMQGIAPEQIEPGYIGNLVGGDDGTDSEDIIRSRSFDTGMHHIAVTTPDHVAGIDELQLEISQRAQESGLSEDQIIDQMLSETAVPAPERDPDPEYIEGIAEQKQRDILDTESIKKQSQDLQQILKNFSDYAAYRNKDFNANDLVHSYAEETGRDLFEDLLGVSIDPETETRVHTGDVLPAEEIIKSDASDVEKMLSLVPGDTESQRNAARHILQTINNPVWPETPERIAPETDWTPPESIIEVPYGDPKPAEQILRDFTVVPDQSLQDAFLMERGGVKFGQDMFGDPDYFGPFQQPITREPVPEAQDLLTPDTPTPAPDAPKKDSLKWRAAKKAGGFAMSEGADLAQDWYERNYLSGKSPKIYDAEWLSSQGSNIPEILVRDGVLDLSDSRDNESYIRMNSIFEQIESVDKDSDEAKRLASQVSDLFSEAILDDEYSAGKRAWLTRNLSEDEDNNLIEMINRSGFQQDVKEISERSAWGQKALGPIGDDDWFLGPENILRTGLDYLGMGLNLPATMVNPESIPLVGRYTSQRGPTTGPAGWLPGVEPEAGSEWFTESPSRIYVDINRADKEMVNSIVNARGHVDDTQWDAVMDAATIDSDDSDGNPIWEQYHGDETGGELYVRNRYTGTIKPLSDMSKSGHKDARDPFTEWIAPLWGGGHPTRTEGADIQKVTITSKTPKNNLPKRVWMGTPSEAMLDRYDTLTEFSDINEDLIRSAR